MLQVCSHLPSGDPGPLGLGHDLEVWSDLGGTSSLRLRHALQLNEAHPAVTGDGQALMVAEPRNLHAGLGACLIHGV